MVPFQYSHSTELLHEPDHGPKSFHFDNWQGLGEQIGWVVFTQYVERLNDLILVLFLNIMVLYVNVFGLTFDCWIHSKEYHSLIV